MGIGAENAIGGAAECSSCLAGVVVCGQGLGSQSGWEALTRKSGWVSAEKVTKIEFASGCGRSQEPAMAGCGYVARQFCSVEIAATGKTVGTGV